jgi:hypothetical protein
MNFLKQIFKASKHEKNIRNYADFWKWFLDNEKSFFEVVKEGKHFEKKFFNKLAPKLDELREGIYFLSGMFDKNTAELVLTPEGMIKNFAIVEELVASAPEIKGWMFTALKQETNIENIEINMAGFNFSGKNISFYSNINKKYPDEIDITIVHSDYSEANKSEIINGTYIFLDNFLGELKTVSVIDNIDFVEIKDVKNELIPIEKLKDFLIWREKEFVEKYDGLRYNIEEDSYTMFEAKQENGNAIIAVVNTELLNWDSKASHPWIATISMKFEGSKTNGMPDNDDFQLMSQIEDDIIENLKDSDGYLNLGRETSNGERIIFIACKEFRKPTIFIPELIQKYSAKIEISFDIYKDKYWQSMSQYSKI